MIRLITSRRWVTTTNELAEARQCADALATELAEATDQLVQVRLQRCQATEYAGRLSEEAAELLAKVQHAERALAEVLAERDSARADAEQARQEPAQVFVLSHQGELHSVHTTEAGAKRATGFPAAAWEDTPASRRLSESLWRVSSLRVEREAS